MKGLGVGDELYDKFTAPELGRICRTGFLPDGVEGDASEHEVPSWCVLSVVQKGQETHLRYFYAFLVSLTTGLPTCHQSNQVALLHGFIIHRFSAVLHDSGYSSTPR